MRNLAIHLSVLLSVPATLVSASVAYGVLESRRAYSEAAGLRPFGPDQFPRGFAYYGPTWTLEVPASSLAVAPTSGPERS